ncbi:MAG: DUF6188 family protein [Acidobacteriota bacterium]
MTTPVTWLSARSLRSVCHDDEAGQWVFDFGEGHVLQVASPWRLVKGGAIALGHCDHGQQFGLPQPVDAEAAAYGLVAGRVVLEAVVGDGSADLVITFDSGIRLEIFNNSSGYEGWNLNAPGGRMLVAQGGGNLVEWKDGTAVD